jgi:hypothetical protein
MLGEEKLTSLIALGIFFTFKKKQLNNIPLHIFEVILSISEKTSKN